MGHHHHHHHDPKHDHGLPPSASSRRVLAIALGLTASFMGVELAVGLWSGSLALVADAGHMLNDSAALGLSLFVAFVAQRPRTRAHTYGFRRAEVMGALVNAFMLVGAGALVLWEAFQRLSERPEIEGGGMLAAAGLGLMVNLIVAWLLARQAKESLNVRAALLHVLGDVLGSVAAIVAGLFVLLFDWTLADPIASAVIAILILVGAYRLLRDTSHVLMEGAPQGLDVAEVEQTIRETVGVDDMHDLHIWSLVPGTPLLSVHVVLTHGAHGTDVARLVGERVSEAHGIAHCTVQPEAPPAPLVELRVARDR